MIDFVSVTERFEKKDIAEQKARKYLSERLFKTAIEEKSQTSRLIKSADTSKPTDNLISSLSADYSRKQKDKEIHKKKLKEAQISFVTRTEDIIDQIIQIIKKEYVYRIENPSKNPEFDIPVSEILGQIERSIKIPAGEVYLILKDLSEKDLELTLIENPDDPEDKKISFFPIADDNINYSLINFRPEEYSNFRITVVKNFLKALKAKKEKRILFQLKKEIGDHTENQKSWFNMLDNLYRYYPLYTEKINQGPDTKKFLRQLDKWKGVFKEI